MFIMFIMLCFSIDTEKILSALRSDPTVEDFFWRESVIGLAKLMLPELFEQMAMPDLRALMVERSMMNVYIRGESFEVLNNSVGLLLEGFIKMQGWQGDLLTAPAVILPCVDQNARQSENLGAGEGSFSQQLLLYQVETRARLIIFDIAGYDPSRTLCKRSSSRISQSADLPSGSLGREQHSGLMSWPEQFFNPKLHDLESSNQQENNLSARAMELSIFGSMINFRRQRASSFPRSRKITPSHSQSYPRVPLTHHLLFLQNLKGLLHWERDLACKRAKWKVMFCSVKNGIRMKVMQQEMTRAKTLAARMIIL